MVQLIVGKKALAVEILPGGGITVREKDTNNPVNTNILVNGIQYSVIDGKAVIPINITIETIEIHDQRYAPFLLRK